MNAYQVLPLFKAFSAQAPLACLLFLASSPPPHTHNTEPIDIVLSGWKVLLYSLSTVLTFPTKPFGRTTEADSTGLSSVRGSKCHEDRLYPLFCLDKGLAS